MRTLLALLVVVGSAVCQNVQIIKKKTTATSITVGPHTSTQNPNAAQTLVTGPIDTTGMNRCFVAVAGYGKNMSTTATIRDNETGTFAGSSDSVWTAFGDSLSASSADVAVFYAIGTGLVNGTTHYFQVDTTGFTTCESIAVACFSGGGTPAWDKKLNAYSSTVTSLQPGSMTPTNPNELIVFACADSSLNITSFSGASLVENVAFSSGKSLALALGYAVQSGGPTASNPTCTVAGSSTVGVTQGAVQ